jgi:hypothetical protein
MNGIAEITPGWAAHFLVMLLLGLTMAAFVIAKTGWDALFF